jgi:hypothetical protein
MLLPDRSRVEKSFCGTPGENPFVVSMLVDIIVPSSATKKISLPSPRHRGPSTSSRTSRHAVGLFQSVNRPDVGMIERRECPRFSSETGATFGIGCKVRTIHLAHAAHSERPDDSVGSELVIHHGGHRAWPT